MLKIAFVHDFVSKSQAIRRDFHHRSGVRLLESIAIDEFGGGGVRVCLGAAAAAPPPLLLLPFAARTIFSVAEADGRSVHPKLVILQEKNFFEC